LQEQAETAEKGWKEARDRLEFMQNHFKEADMKNKKQIANLKEDNKGKERELKKTEGELARLKEKCTFLEEKVVTLKEDFKSKDKENQEAFDKKVTALEEKVNDFRTRLKKRDEEYNEMSQVLKEEKRVNCERLGAIEGLEQRIEVMQQDMEAQVKLSRQEATALENRMEAEKQSILRELEDSQKTVCSKEMEVRELQSRLEQAGEFIADLEGDNRKLLSVRGELEERQKEAVSRIAVLEQDVQEKENLIANLQDKIRQLENIVEANLKELKAKATCIDALEQDKRFLNERIAEMEATNRKNINNLEICIKDKESEISELREEIAALKIVSANQQQEIESLNMVIKDKTLSNELLEACNKEINENLNRATEAYKEELKSRDKSINELNSQLQESNRINENLTLRVKQLEEAVDSFKSQVEELREDLELKKKEYEEKEAELNWIYKQKLEEANHETQQKVEILKLQEEKLSEIQRQLLSAKQSGEEKDLEIFRREDSIRKLEGRLVQSREEMASKERLLEEKEEVLNRLNNSLAQSHQELQEKEKVLQVGHQKFLHTRQLHKMPFIGAVFCMICSTN
jgi:epidermal growth factor receptor substrate 15